MTLLAKRSIVKEDKSNIITLGAIAKEEKKKDPAVVNATIGMLYDEDEKLFAYKSVDNALSLFLVQYPPADQGPARSAYTLGVLSVSLLIAVASINPSQQHNLLS